jgi:hypothetical protein
VLWPSARVRSTCWGMMCSVHWAWLLSTISSWGAATLLTSCQYRSTVWTAMAALACWTILCLYEIHYVNSVRELTPFASCTLRRLELDAALNKELDSGKDETPAAGLSSCACDSANMPGPQPQVAAGSTSAIMVDPAITACQLSTPWWERVLKRPRKYHVVK